VLDIGSGSGLLAMMAARGGAGKVTSVEVVPAVAHIARQIVAANGYDDTVTVHNCRSDELALDAMGSRADIVVSELIDDHVIGDGVLQSHQDARRRLLVPRPVVIPWGGKIWAWPLQMRLPAPKDVNLNELHLPRCAQVIMSHPYYSFKLQHSPERYFKPLADPVHLFDFDWGSGPLDTLADSRTTEGKVFTFRTSGTFNAIAILFTLQMDSDPEHDYSACMDNPDTHWDQPIRFLPTELSVLKGQTLKMIATHNEHDVEQIKIRGVREDMQLGQVGIALPKKMSYKLHVVLEE